MGNVREEGKLELTEALRSSTAAEGIPEGFRRDRPERVAPGGAGAVEPHTRGSRLSCLVDGQLSPGIF